jgi:hypothetical protein
MAIQAWSHTPAADIGRHATAQKTGKNGCDKQHIQLGVFVQHAVCPQDARHAMNQHGATAVSCSAVLPCKALCSSTVRSPAKGALCSNQSAVCFAQQQHYEQCVQHISSLAASLLFKLVLKETTPSQNWHPQGSVLSSTIHAVICTAAKPPCCIKPCCTCRSAGLCTA